MRAPVRALAWSAFGLATLVFASPIKSWWARPSLGWLFPFVLWLAVIAAGAWVNRARDSGDDDDD